MSIVPENILYPIPNRVHTSAFNTSMHLSNEAGNVGCKESLFIIETLLSPAVYLKRLNFSHWRHYSTDTCRVWNLFI